MARTRRGRRGRGGRRSRRTASVGRHLSRPLVNIRPKNWRHTRPGHGIVSSNCRRKLSAYPLRPETGKNWVMDLLTWAGKSVMSLIGQKVTVSLTDLVELVGLTEFEDVFGTAYPLDAAVPTLQPLGAFTSWYLGPEDLLTEHPGFSSYQEDKTKKFMWNEIFFESGCIDWIQVSVHPGVSVSQREGQIALAVQPYPSVEPKGDWQHWRSFHEIMTMPSSVCGSASRPLTVTWSPTIRDQGLVWKAMGCQKIDGNFDNIPGNITAQVGYKQPIGGGYSVVVYFGYSAHGDGEVGAGHYAPSSAGFSVFIDGRVSLRTPTSESSVCRVGIRSVGGPKVYEAGIYGQCKNSLDLTEAKVLDPHARRIIVLSDTAASIPPPSMEH